MAAKTKIAEALEAVDAAERRADQAMITVQVLGTILESALIALKTAGIIQPAHLRDIFVKADARINEAPQESAFEIEAVQAMRELVATIASRCGVHGSLAAGPRTSTTH